MKRIILTLSVSILVVFNFNSISGRALSYESNKFVFSDPLSINNIQLSTGDFELNVVSALEQMIEEFKNQLDLIDSHTDQANDYRAQIQELESNLDFIRNRQSMGINPSSSEMNLLIESSSMIVPDSCTSFYISKIAIVAWFQANNYKLSAELLNYSFINRTLGKHYIPNPNNVSQILKTSWYQYMRNQNYPGNGTFTTGDLFYSIHKFNYYYGYDFDIFKYLVIEDVYDFEYGDQSYPSVAGAAINMMYFAQRLGCLVPYTTSIYLPAN